MITGKKKGTLFSPRNNAVYVYLNRKNAKQKKSDDQIRVQYSCPRKKHAVLLFKRISTR